MTYDGEIRLKAVVDKSGVVDLEADLGEVEKKAGDAEKAVQDIKLDDSTEKSAKRAAGGVQDLARETRKATKLPCICKVFSTSAQSPAFSSADK